MKGIKFHWFRNVGVYAMAKLLLISETGICNRAENRDYQDLIAHQHEVTRNGCVAELITSQTFDFCVHFRHFFFIAFVL